jgi:hypothetical protein
MEELMHSKAAVLAVLRYLFARFEERFDGAPTLLILDEAWLFLDDPVFAARIRQWLKTLRKKNVSVIFATQSLADIKDSSIAPAIIESCASRIFLPNPQATEPQIRTIYEGFGLNSRQIEIVATAQPKRDYYYQSRLGNRLFDLDLGPATLAFAGASTPQDQRDIDACWPTPACPASRAPGCAIAASIGRLTCCPRSPASRRVPSVPLTTPRRTSHENTPKLAALTASACSPSASRSPRMPVRRRRHRARPDQSRAEHADGCAHAGADQQPDPPAPERSADAHQPGAQPGQPAVQRGRPVAREPGDHPAADRAGQGLAYDVTSIDREFARLYPEKYAATVSGNQMYLDAQERWKNTLNGLQTTMQMQAQASQNLSDDEGVLADLVGKSQSAEGALQAMQAMNQLLALQAKQSIQTQRLQITQDRAAALELARQAAATERGREVTRRFLGEGTPYTPQPVNFYNR